ncbi:hypothetical protein DSL72_004132 [Monilinia vaccinii-corymbosi]|uniref:Uncharacterized protein n=1 Tax=Monilinia vaccinii-corymbosi TaxID=61207 RepID=A0A8A3P340_9HELO|nr:hypothetical protein DSL72_004132 [Monilinia vaccinii-corymbosi]
MVSATFSDQVLQTSSATTTTWLPLSTAWPSTAACSSLVYIGTGKDAGKLFGWDPLYQAVLDTGSPRCFADEMVSWWFGTTISLGPTFNCPAAYSTVATSVHSAGVTQIFCCPTDYKLSTLIPSHTAGDYPNQCMSTLSSGDILKYQTPTGGIYQPTTLTVSETLLVHGEHINGWNIDGAVFAAMTGAPQNSLSTASLSSSPSKTLESITAPSSPSTSTPNTKSSGVSPALAAGIGVTTGIIVIGLAAALSILIRRRKKSAGTDTHAAKEISATETYSSPQPDEQPAGELPVESPPREIHGGRKPTLEKGYYALGQHVHEM